VLGNGDGALSWLLRDGGGEGGADELADAFARDDDCFGQVRRPLLRAGETTTASGR
jgi:hypothetical protein